MWTVIWTIVTVIVGGCGMGLCVDPLHCGPNSVANLPGPPPPVGLTASTGPAPGTLTLELDYPDDRSPYSRIDIRGVFDSDVPPVDCTSGFVLMQITDFSVDEITVPTHRANSQWSLRLCAYGVNDALNGNTVSSGVFSQSVTHQLFTSSAVTTGNLGGLEGADSFCQGLADAASLPGDWRAYLSDGWNNAGDRMSVHGPAVFTTGAPAAASADDLKSGTWSSIPSWDEEQTDLALRQVFTGTIAGVKDWSFGNYCANWTSDSIRFSAVTGRAYGINGWINNTSQSCAGSHSVYCINQSFIAPLVDFSASPGDAVGEVELSLLFPSDTAGYGRVDIRRSNQLPPPSGTCVDGDVVQSFTEFDDATWTDTPGSQGRFGYTACVYNPYGERISSFSSQSATRGFRQEIFLSNTRFSGGPGVGGVAQLDALCAASALGAGLNTPETSGWKAVVSTSTDSAESRISFTTPIFNVRNGLVAQSGGDLWATGPEIAINFSETARDAGAAMWVFSGSTNSGAINLAGGTICGNYTNAVGNIRAGASTALVSWLSASTLACSSDGYLYCISE